jgi:hypothetical protein
MRDRDPPICDFFPKRKGPGMNADSVMRVVLETPLLKHSRTVLKHSSAPGGGRSAARASIGAETSTTSTCPEGPTRSASAIELAPGTAADIDDTLALPHLSSLQRCLQDRTQHDVLRLLAFDPTTATSAIPVVDFGLILWVVLDL